MDEEASLLDTSTHEEDAILETPTEIKQLSLPQGAQSATSPEATPHKKIVLKRKLVTEVTVSDSARDAATAASSEAAESKVAKVESSDSEEGGDKGVVKVAQLTALERLELRAKKFGAAPSRDAAKQARAERFGLGATAAEEANGQKPESAGKLSREGTAVSVDVLKKRAERFGGSVSTVMSKLDNAEKLKKRQERFGQAATNSGTETAANADPKVAGEYAEKAKLRAERFKTSVSSS